MKIAILGCGTIGYGVYDILNKNYSQIVVKKIFDKDFSKQDEVKGIITTSLDDILNDKEIELVVETLGGLDFAFSCIKKCIEHKKHVVTANKEVVSIYLDEITDLKNEYNVSFSFEAAVGGGIPIIKNIIDIANTNEITEISGILNGTTNYILTLLSEGKTFPEALAIAQEMGFAEKDPSSDLEGLDMVRKISILTSIAKNQKVDINSCIHYPIKNCTKEDIDFAKRHAFKIKYIASFSNDHLSVEPTFVSVNSRFSNVNYEYNLISLKASNYGVLEFFGKGAGRYATASAIVNDIIDIEKENQNYTFTPSGKLEVKDDNIKRMFYLRLKKNINLEEDKVLYRDNNKVITRYIGRHQIDFSKVDFYAVVKQGEN